MKWFKNTFVRLISITIIVFILANQMVSAQVHCMENLNSISDFNDLKAKPLTNKYGNVEALKVVYDLKTKTLYFINSKRYKYHYNFCFNYLGHSYKQYEFNTYNYAAKHKSKRYLLGNINHYKSNDLYTLELSPIDQMSIEDIAFLYAKIQETSYLKNFKFFLHTTRLENLKSAFSIPTLSASHLYGEQTYQAISTYKSYGKLRYINYRFHKTI